MTISSFELGAADVSLNKGCYVARNLRKARPAYDGVITNKLNAGCWCPDEARQLAGWLLNRTQRTTPTANRPAITSCQALPPVDASRAVLIGCLVRRQALRRGAAACEPC